MNFLEAQKTALEGKPVGRFDLNIYDEDTKKVFRYIGMKYDEDFFMFELKALDTEGYVHEIDNPNYWALKFDDWEILPLVSDKEEFY